MNKERKNIRKKIIQLLERKAMNVSELMNCLKDDISSFGTLAYHLKRLKEQGVIKADKKRERGQPTYYSIIPGKKDRILATKREVLIILKLLSEGKSLKDIAISVNEIKLALKSPIIIKMLEQDGFIKTKHFLTRKGKQFLKTLK